jgi:cytochrome c-type biogenesis protein CcmH/NrfG
MAANVLPLVLLVVLLLPAPAVAGPAPPQSKSQAQQSERIRQGVSYFERAFYQLTPHKRDVEAAREFDLAIAQFEGELAVQPRSAEALAYLAKIYAVRKDYGKAAAHYDRLSELEPANVEACVLAALAYVENGQIAEARTRLLAAKERTSDPDALSRLAEYMSKLDQLKR